MKTNATMYFDDNKSSLWVQLTDEESNKLDKINGLNEAFAMMAAQGKFFRELCTLHGVDARKVTRIEYQ